MGRAVRHSGRGRGYEVGYEVSQVAVLAAQEVPRATAQREPEAAEQGRGDKGEVALWSRAGGLFGHGVGERLEQALGGTLPLVGLGRPPRHLGLGHGSHMVTDHHVLGHQEGEELVQGGPGPGDARSRVAFRERGEGRPQHLGVELAQDELARGDPELGCQVGRHPGQVSPVVGLGVRPRCGVSPSVACGRRRSPRPAPRPVAADLFVAARLGGAGVTRLVAVGGRLLVALGTPTAYRRPA
jgi:hypothetical protein